MSDTKAFICSPCGPFLTTDEQAFFAHHKPWGFILFGRNCQAPDQISELCKALRASVNDVAAPIFIDQEGGRVQRLKPPLWHHYPSAYAYAMLYQKDKKAGIQAVRLAAHLIAYDLLQIGIDGNCLPVLDVPQPGAHQVIGDRAYGNDPVLIANLGGVAAQTLLQGGVLPVMKHIPGHGRANVDTHFDVPRVSASLSLLQETDFSPFRALSHLPIAMTAHVIYEAIDRDAPCTTSRAVISSAIREFIGFDGLLMSDDISMKALDGKIGARAVACFAAGCDLVLHCNGDFAEMDEVAYNTPILSGKAAKRAKLAFSHRQSAKPFDVDATRDKLDTLIAAL